MHTLSSLETFLSAVTAVFEQDGVIEKLFGAPTPFSLSLVATLDSAGVPHVHGRGLGVSGLLPSQRPKHRMEAARSLVDALLVLEGVSRGPSDPQTTIWEISPTTLSAHALVGPIGRVRAHLAALGWDGNAWTTALITCCQNVVVHGADALHPRYSSWSVIQDNLWTHKEALGTERWDTWRRMGMRRPTVLLPLLASLAPIAGKALGMKGPAGILVRYDHQAVDQGFLHEIQIHGLPPTPDDLWLQKQMSKAVGAIAVHAGFSIDPARSPDYAYSTSVLGNADDVFLSAHDRMAYMEATAAAFARIAWPGRAAFLSGDQEAIARHQDALRALMRDTGGFAALRAEAHALDQQDQHP